MPGEEHAGTQGNLIYGGQSRPCLESNVRIACDSLHMAIEGALYASDGSVHFTLPMRRESRRLGSATLFSILLTR